MGRMVWGLALGLLAGMAGCESAAKKADAEPLQPIGGGDDTYDCRTDTDCAGNTNNVRCGDFAEVEAERRAVGAAAGAAGSGRCVDVEMAENPVGGCQSDADCQGNKDNVVCNAFSNCSTETGAEDARKELQREQQEEADAAAARQAAIDQANARAQDCAAHPEDCQPVQPGQPGEGESPDGTGSDTGSTSSDPPGENYDQENQDRENQNDAQEEQQQQQENDAEQREQNLENSSQNDQIMNPH